MLNILGHYKKPGWVIIMYCNVLHDFSFKNNEVHSYMIIY